MRVNVPAIDELVREYCMYRGLLEGGSQYSANGKGSSSSAVAAHLSNVLAAGVENCFKAIGVSGPRLHTSAAGPSEAAEHERPIVSGCTGSDDHKSTENGMGKPTDLNTLHVIAGFSQTDRSNSAASDVVMEEPDAQREGS